MIFFAALGILIVAAELRYQYLNWSRTRGCPSFSFRFIHYDIVAGGFDLLQRLRAYVIEGKTRHDSRD